MRIKYKSLYSFQKELTECSVADAVEGCMQETYGEGGQIEGLSADQREGRQFVGKLVEILADKGILNIEDLKKLLNAENMKVIS